MKITEISKIVEKLSYKPGWSFSSRYREFGNGVEILIQTLPVLDATGKNYTNESPVRSLMYIQPEALKEQNQLLHLIISRLQDLELHEMNEWLKFDGKWMRNPHPGNEFYDLYKWGDK